MSANDEPEYRADFTGASFTNEILTEKYFKKIFHSTGSEKYIIWRADQLFKTNFKCC